MNNQSDQVNFLRRSFIKYGGTIVGTSLMATVLGSNLISPNPGVAKNDLTPDEALTKLLDGRSVESRYKTSY